MRKWIIILAVGVVVFVVSIVLPLFLLLPMISEEDRPQLLIPGSMHISVQEPGKYYLWDDYETVFKGRTYFHPEGLPGGLRITLMKVDSNEHIEIVGDSSFTSKRGSSSRRSIGYFDLLKGEYLLKVQGDTEPRVFSFGQSVFTTHFVLLVLGSVLFQFVGLGLTALGTIFVVRNGLSSRKQRPSVGG